MLTPYLNRKIYISFKNINKCDKIVRGPLNMKVLGINYTHDGSASIVIDGELIAAAEEERFVRQKHARGFPYNAVNFCLDRAGLDLNEVDFIAIPWFGFNIHSSYADLLYAIWKLKKGRTVLFKKIFSRLIKK